MFLHKMLEEMRQNQLFPELIPGLEGTLLLLAEPCRTSLCPKEKCNSKGSKCQENRSHGLTEFGKDPQDHPHGPAPLMLSPSATTDAWNTPRDGDSSTVLGLVGCPGEDPTQA